MSTDKLKTSHHRALVSDAVLLTIAPPLKERRRDEHRQIEDEPPTWPRRRRNPLDSSVTMVLAPTAPVDELLEPNADVRGVSNDMTLVGFAPTGPGVEHGLRAHSARRRVPRELVGKRSAETPPSRRAPRACFIRGAKLEMTGCPRSYLEGSAHDRCFWHLVLNQDY
jgi:hypothetical protein